MRLTRLVEDYLFGWVLLAAVVGMVFPGLSVLTQFSTPILAIMVGSTSLTISMAHVRSVDRAGLGVALLGHAAMAFLAFAVARGLGLSPGLTAGFVVLGAVTPELVTPTMTALADGDTALASVALVVIGGGSLAYVPLVATLLLGDSVAVDSLAIVRQLLVAVVAPMALAVGARTRYPDAIASRDAYYSTVAAIMVVLIIAGVTAANALLVRANVAILAVVGVGAVMLNVAGYLLGWVSSVGLDRESRVAVTLTVGMRDFAIAAALLAGAGFPAIASLPAVCFGILEMASSAGLARIFATP